MVVGRPAIRMKKETGKTETYNTEELKLLTKYLDGMYAETNDVVFLTVKLNFPLGLRVGESVACSQGKRNSFTDRSPRRLYLYA